MTDILEITDLEVTYQRSILALHGVNLRVAKGQITSLLGANGAGKSTTLRAISGFIGLDNARVNLKPGPLSWRRHHRVAIAPNDPQRHRPGA